MVAASDFLTWQRLSALVGLVSITGRIDGCKPVSLLLHGAPNSGKTQMLKRYDVPDNTHMLFGTNASSWGIADVLEHKIPQGVACIVAPEFQTWIYRKGAVWEALQGLLLPAMDEGVGTIYNGPNPRVFNGARLGLIAAMPDNAFLRERPSFQTTGLLSRMMVISWNRHPDDILQSRFAFNAGDRRELAKIRIALPPVRPRIDFPIRLADQCAVFAHATAENNVNRELDRLIAITKAHAYVHQRNEATQEDWDQIKEYSALWRGGN